MTYADLLARAAPYLHLRALDGEQTGAMVALVPSAEDAARLAVPGGEPADQLHATLVYLGEAAAIPADVRAGLVERLRGLIEDAVRPDLAVPVVADGFAVSMFNPAGPAPCVVLGLSGADLDAVHRLVEAATAEVFAAPEQHRPWIGHVTLEYTGDAARVEDLVDRAGPVTFDRLRLAFAGENVDLPLAPARARSAVLSPYPAVREALEVYLNLPPLHVRYSDDQPRDELGRFGEGGGGGGSSSSSGKLSGGGKPAATGQDALDATPATYRSGPRAHYGEYEGAEFDAPPGAGDPQALAEYEGVEYETTNSYLRSGPMADNPNMAGFVTDSVRERDAETARRIAEIDKTMSVSRLTSDVETERVIKSGRSVFGQNWHEGVMNEGTTDFDEQDREYERWIAGDRPDLTGMSWREDAYVSTSVNPGHSEAFGARWAASAQEFPDTDGEPVIMKITVPAGTGAVQLGDMGWSTGPGGRQIMNSGEIMLDRGLTMTVTADHGVDDQGFRRLDVRASNG